jgi:uncharacterized protein (DUF111 family)
MKLFIDPAGGLAGDMFSAALISLGVPFSSIKSPMTFAAKKLGEANISTKVSEDGAQVLTIKLNSISDHLSEKTGRQILTDTFNKFSISPEYIDFGYRILSILLNAEEKAHKNYKIVITGHHHHGPVLHEAQDIIIDILGACYGLDQLDITPRITQINPVSLGGGEINFSHGLFTIPAPATSTIIKDYSLVTKQGPVNFELFTPTGAAILAALKPEYLQVDTDDLSIDKTGISRGTRQLNIPPLKLFLSS